MFVIYISSFEHLCFKERKVDDVQSALKTNELTNFKNLKVDSSEEFLNVSRRRDESKGKRSLSHGQEVLKG